MVTDVRWRHKVLDKPLPVRNGFLELGAAPGLGFDPIEIEVESHPGVPVRRPRFYV